MHVNVFNPDSNKEKVAGRNSSIVCFSPSLKETWRSGTTQQQPRKRVLKGFIGVKEWVQHSVPLHFVCKRLGVLNHLALFRWGGAGPASDGQEAIETQLVTRPAAAAANKTHVWGPTFEAKRRGVALPLRLVIGTRGRSCRQEKKRRDRRGCLRHRSHNQNGTF